MDNSPNAGGQDNGPGNSLNDKPDLHKRLRRFLFGKPRDLNDRRIFHRLSVIAFLAWVGLGADGLSSSAYGPEEAFRTLGQHTYLAVPIALLMIATVLIISACYIRIIERFPHGGGGYVVATALLGEKMGVVSGSALLIDYVLTITVSIAAAGDAIFSFLPADWRVLKLPTEILLIVLLTIINIRGVKESIIMLMPVFLLFLATHAVLIFGGIAANASQLPATAMQVSNGFSYGATTLGIGGMALLFIHAFSLGGGTYTGIEAVSNGLPIMREPRQRTAKWTMIYMAASLAVTAGGLVVCYLVWNVQFDAEKTLNAVLSENVAQKLSLGKPFVILTLISEGALLVVAAQAGFIDGPRVLANMAVDSWTPRRFSCLSEKLTTQNGIVLMGAAALAALWYTNGNIQRLVVMYSINVFITFSLSMLGMARSLWSGRGGGRPWKRQLALFVVGLTFCLTILSITVVEKFGEGGWLTLLTTSLVVLACFGIRKHYRQMNVKLANLYANLACLPKSAGKICDPVDPSQPTAAILVGGYSGLGIHTMLAALRMFPGQFKNLLFLSVGVIDSGIFKGADTMDYLRKQTEDSLKKYADMAREQGMPATYRMAVGTDLIEEMEKLCLEEIKKFPSITFFAGQLIFHRPRWYQAILHNGTAFAIQKRLQLAERTLVILPARVK
ncbi:MAG: APC family permease [Planctomycetes bacterium]|nr:APC family permease [Planctomycetota bacterium]